MYTTIVVDLGEVHLVHTNHPQPSRIPTKGGVADVTRK